MIRIYFLLVVYVFEKMRLTRDLSGQYGEKGMCNRLRLYILKLLHSSLIYFIELDKTEGFSEKM